LREADLLITGQQQTGETQFTAIKKCTPYGTYKTIFQPLKIQRFLYAKDGTEKQRGITFNLFDRR